MRDTKAKPIVQLKKIAKKYDDEAGKLIALHGVDFEIDQGDFVAIMGPSGSGKSTLMNILGLLDLPSEGEYLLDGSNIMGVTEAELARLRRDKIGFVFQSFNLLPRFNILENVQLPLMYQGVSARKRKKQAKQMLDSVNLGDKLKNKPSQLSGGQVQRAAIARALINEPELILADEPTGNLDSKTSTEIMELLTKLNKDGVTVVVVTHDPDVASFAKRIINVRDGKVEVKK